MPSPGEHYRLGIIFFLPRRYQWADRRSGWFFWPGIEDRTRLSGSCCFDTSASDCHHGVNYLRSLYGACRRGDRASCDWSPKCSRRGKSSFGTSQTSCEQARARMSAGINRTGQRYGRYFKRTSTVVYPYLEFVLNHPPCVRPRASGPLTALGCLDLGADGQPLSIVDSLEVLLFPCPSLTA